MSKFFLGNLFLGLSITSQALGQVVLKSLMKELDGHEGLVDKLQQMLVFSRIWRGGVFVVAIGIGFLAWMVCLSKLDLSYAYTVACGSALLVTALSVAFLGETATPKMWLGAVLIMAGTALLVPSK
jgi:multidrug transporter EmrE-like cation transporter